MYIIERYIYIYIYAWVQLILGCIKNIFFLYTYLYSKAYLKIILKLSFSSLRVLIPAVTDCLHWSPSDRNSHQFYWTLLNILAYLISDMVKTYKKPSFDPPILTVTYPGLFRLFQGLWLCYQCHLPHLT